MIIKTDKTDIRMDKKVSKIERGKRAKIKPVDDMQLIYVSSAQKKYAEFVREIRKYPHKLYEHYTGEKLPLWKQIYIDTICKLKKTDYEKQQKAIDNAIKPFIRKG